METPVLPLAGCGETLAHARSLPQALKRGQIFNDLAARLKSCPSPNRLGSEFFWSLRGSRRDEDIALDLMKFIAMTTGYGMSENMPRYETFTRT